MANHKDSGPRLYPGVMVSSTFTDLREHRAALISAIKGQGLTDVAMENDSAKADVDVIDSSLQMVRDGSAYIGVIGRKYGQTPVDAMRNPGALSITELEFNEAQRLERPILLFIMGEKHLLHEADIEIDAAKREKLNAFRERAKQMRADSSVHRVYAVFDNLDEFAQKAIHAVAGLRRFLDEKETPVAEAQTPLPIATQPDPIPRPPAFYAEPRYSGSHQFVGRQAQLDVLSDWAAAADPHPVLLFDAIGGSGKSMLTWEWTINHATQIRGDWAGRFWYSFYERGAIMADFCGRALAYMTGQPFEHFKKMKTLELSEKLLRQLEARPWLLILDGLERVLVAYHRFDAAGLADEEADRPTDQIAHRDPCSAIRPEDDDLLRALAGAAPSKLLVTSRLVPRVLLNPASQPIPGVLRVALPGLRPADAEALLRSCNIDGDSQAIQSYLKSHCDCHPLVTGILAGLINDDIRNRGNFDAWAADPAGGGRLNLANLDLIQKRNHILNAALNALPEKNRQLLSTLALLSEAVDSDTLSALNPHLPPELNEVEEPPYNPKDLWWDEDTSDAEKEQDEREYQVALQKYKAAVRARQQLPEFIAAKEQLDKTVRDLEQRGLLQYDAGARRYDLHPVVRGIAAGGLKPDETERYGQRVVDHFSQQSHNPYEQAETLEDLRDGLHLVRTLLKMGRYQQACDAYSGDLGNAIEFNLEAYADVLSLLRPFFPQGWAALPTAVYESDRSSLANDAANALDATGEVEEALAAYGVALLSDLEIMDWSNTRSKLSNISLTLANQGRLAKEDRYNLQALELAVLAGYQGGIFRTQLNRFRQLADLGRVAEAEAIWKVLDSMGRDWERAIYLPGDAEYNYIQFRFWQGNLSEEQFLHAEQLARTGKNRLIIRSLHSLRGAWRLEQGEWALAAESLREAVRMARAIGQNDAQAETQLTLARFRLGQLPNPHQEAEQLAQASYVSYRCLADLWLAIGDQEQAKKHALLAYKKAWADGEPYVFRYELNKATVLLGQLGVEIPNLPPYDPAKDEKLPWEEAVAAAIEKLRAEKQAKNTKENADDADLADFRR